MTPRVKKPNLKARGHLVESIFNGDVNIFSRGGEAIVCLGINGTPQAYLVWQLDIGLYRYMYLQRGGL